MGVKGPIPKRSTEGHRTTQARKLDGGVEPVNVVAEQVKPPKPDPDWHPIAKKLWKAVEQSTFTRYYEPSDWILLFDACDEISVYKNGGMNRSAVMRASLNQMLAGLLLTEGDRRRARVEIERDTKAEPEESAGIVAMKDFLAKRASNG